MSRVAPSHRQMAELLAGAAVVVLWGAALSTGGRAAILGAGATTLLLMAALALHRSAHRRLARQRDQDATALREIARALGPGAPQDGASGVSPPSALARRIGEIRAEGEALAAILDAVDEPVLAVDADGVVSLANRAAAAMVSGGSGPPVVGTPLDQLLPDEHALGVVRGAVRGEPSRGQTRLLTAEGARVLEIGAEPLERPPGARTGAGAVVTLRDVTEQANAMQLKTDFVANASHELRTPLASIKTAAETLADMGDAPTEIRSRLVSVIASNAERLEELTRDLLDLSSLESPGTPRTVERVDVPEMAAQLRELFEAPAALRRVSLSFEIEERLRAVWTDGRLLRLVLRNLIDNAVKFAYEDTAVVVRGSVRERPGSERGDARFEVIDRGIGIPLAQQQRIFERFYQVDAARSGPARRRGTGLGLAIVKHALRALGGTIQVSSVWQQGTTMTVDLPGCVEHAHP